MSDKTEEGKITEKAAGRISEALANSEVQQFIQNYYAAENKKSYAYLAIKKWTKGEYYPPADILAAIAKILETNIAYLLELTDINTPCEFIDPPVEHSLKELLAMRCMTETELAKALNNNYKMVQRISESLSDVRVHSLMRLSKALDLSVDFILGYTNWETWEMQLRVAKPFRSIDAGAGAYLVADRMVKSVTDIQDAINRGDGQYCLVTSDGKYVLFPNGNRFSVDDEMFYGLYVAKVKPEVE